MADVCDFSIPGDSDICYECDAECVGAVFCGFGGQDTPDVRLPKILNVTIRANPSFWGFPGVLFSGDITYSSSKFDYWNNFEENWLVDKTCGDTTIRDLDNEQRPDVKYRSVYDPDSGTTTYEGNTEIDEIGGPSVYLIDRDATKTTDAVSCDETDPGDVFRHHPENFGFGNKILFEEDIYKNISAAWRGADTGVPNFTFNENGLPDGAVVGQYAGNVTGVYRDTATDPFIHLQVQYTGGQASAIRNGQILYLNSTCANQTYESQYLPDGAYYLTKVTDNGSYTDCALVGSVGTEDFSESLTSSTWIIAGSLDEQTCRSRRAHGVDYENKCADLDYNYHADLGVVINDSRNRIHSNRETRDKFGWTNTRSADDKPRRDYTYVSVQESGHGLLVKETETDNVALACETGIWDPTWDFIYTSGDDYYSAFKPEDLFSVSGYHSDAPSTLVNIGSGLILTCGCTSGEPLGLCDISTGCLPLGWSKYAVSSGMYPIYGRELPFYGPFYEVYDKDNAVRNWQQDNTIKARNNTCYTPLATLEVYPDCITQEQLYTQCGGGETYLRTNVERLAFVYRCFDYQEPCSYYESGLPYSGVPTNIDQLRQGLAGQEVYMYLNIGDAWAGEINRDPCGCGPGTPPGNQPPNMLTIESPVTFPCFLNFDNNPNAYGAQDQLWKRYAANFLGESIPASSCPADIEGDYGFPQQPYTTYGFIRNVCGKETNSSKAVIQALNEVNTGNYRNTTPEDDTVEPMYWEFPPISPSGGIGGGWGTNLTETFVNDSGTYATWGIVDNNNRLVAPYYPVESGDQLEYCPPYAVEVTYNKFDAQEAFRGNWPKDNVPFLISITHDNSCVGCTTTNMATGDLIVSLQGLDAGYIHNSNNKYGYNNCEQSDTVSNTLNIEPDFSCASGFPSEYCEGEFSYGELVTTQAGTGVNTCPCVSTSFTMSGDYWTGTNIPKWFRSDFQRLPTCMYGGIKFTDQWTALSNGLLITEEKIPYVGASFGCSDAGIGNAAYDARVLSDMYAGYETNPLSYVYDCGGCSHSYPGVNRRPDLKLDWWVVRDQYQFIWEEMSRDDIYTNQVAIQEGISVEPGARLSSGVYGLSTNLGGCEGSTVTIYGCKPSGTPPGYGQDGFVVVCLGASPEITCSGASGVWDFDFDLTDLGCENSGCHSTTYTIDAREVLNRPPSVCGCVCAGLPGTGDVLYHWEYNVASGQYVSTAGGEILENVNNGDCPPIYWYFSGSGIPGFGNLPVMPIGEPMAYQVSYNITDAYCEWKNDADPNNTVEGITHKIIPPGNASDIYFPGGVGNTPCGGLWPRYCDEQWLGCSGDSTAYTSTCYHPIYDSTDVVARRKRAYPEIMTVHKIDCLGDGSGYNLHVSREYHDHSRAWRYPIDGYTCDFYYGAVDGGGYNWRLTNTTSNTAECPEFYFHPCSSDFASLWPAVNTGSPYDLEGPYPSYYLLPHSIPSDQVTPAWPTENDSADSTARSMCTQHPHSGSMPNYHVTRDFQKTITPYRAAHTEWIQLQESDGPVQLPLYTGVLSTPDTGVYGDYCDALYATGELVNIWLPRSRTYLPASVSDNLESAGLNANIQESGSLSCSGVLWAVSGEPLLKYDQNGTIRYFTEESLAVSQCDTNQKYPDLSGVTLWNYYNLFYGSGDPNADYYNYVDIIQPDEEGDCNDPGRQAPPWNFVGNAPTNIDDDHFGPLYTEPDDIPLNRRHSCIQDSVACGGELWNNKMFFPRKPYESGTRVTAFGALSICTQDTTYETSSWLEGYEDLSSNGTPDILREAINTRFIDACDLDAHSVTLQDAVGIDDVIIHVDDYLPLLGMYFVDRKTELGDWTCLQPDSGCYDFLPIHSEQTLDVMSFTPSETWSTNKNVSLGYHLDKLVTVAQDECLFKPFKIMVDVDCCPDVIRKRGQEGNEYDPTFMQFIDTDAPAGICLNHTNPPRCGCASSYCNDVYKKYVPDVCLSYIAFERAVESTGVCDDIHILPSGADPCDFIINSGGNPFGGKVYDSPQATPDCYIFFIDGGPTIGSVSALDINAVTSSECLISPDCYPDPGCDPYNSGICYINEGESGVWDVIDGTVGTLVYSGTVPAALCGDNYYIEAGYENGGSAGSTGCCSFTNDYCSIFDGTQSWYKMTEDDFGGLICDLSNYDVSDTGLFDPDVLATGWKECGCGGGTASFISASEFYNVPDCIDNSIVLATITEG